jgi:hypothetical protein
LLEKKAFIGDSVKSIFKYLVGCLLFVSLGCSKNSSAPNTSSNDDEKKPAQIQSVIDFSEADVEIDGGDLQFCYGERNTEFFQLQINQIKGCTGLLVLKSEVITSNVQELFKWNREIRDFVTAFAKSNKLKFHLSGQFEIYGGTYNLDSPSSIGIAFVRRAGMAKFITELADQAKKLPRVYTVESFSAPNWKLSLSGYIIDGADKAGGCDLGSSMLHTDVVLFKESKGNTNLSPKLLQDAIRAQDAFMVQAGIYSQSSYASFVDFVVHNLPRSSDLVQDTYYGKTWFDQNIRGHYCIFSVLSNSKPGWYFSGADYSQEHSIYYLNK